ncbi:c-type cytochrome [Caenimonas terrae]|uniref:C-type cytochrome n=1 Tax=Caenimonas terrae TaxID=696074 RepID=A0ABW0NIB6_9BURK
MTARRPGLRQLGPALRLAAIAGAIALAGCGRTQGPGAAGPAPQAGVPVEALSALPLGDESGGAQNNRADMMPNPQEGNPESVQEGRRLFVSMNCAGCHGYDAKGGMGPDLTDTSWRYGGVPAMLFKSIYEGRPEGMPAWNPALPPDQIWKLVSYLQSLGGTFPPGSHQAWVQGDRAGDLVPPQVTRTLPEGAQAPAPQGKDSSATWAHHPGNK